MARDSRAQWPQRPESKGANGEEGAGISYIQMWDQGWGTQVAGNPCFPVT